MSAFPSRSETEWAIHLAVGLGFHSPTEMVKEWDFARGAWAFHSAQESVKGWASQLARASVFHSRSERARDLG